MCQTGSNPSVNTYWNNNLFKTSTVLDESNPKLGLNNTIIIVKDNIIEYSFSRLNTLDKPNYFSTSNGPVYLLAAFGSGNFIFILTKIKFGFRINLFSKVRLAIT